MALWPKPRERTSRYDDVLQECDRLLEALVARHDAVLVLDAEHVVVADQAQVRDDVLPDDRVVPVAARPEDPGPLQLARVLLGVEDAIDHDVARIDAAILRMDVVDAVAEPADRGDHVDPLPAHAAGLEFAADRPWP